MHRKYVTARAINTVTDVAFMGKSQNRRAEVLGATAPVLAFSLEEAPLLAAGFFTFWSKSILVSYAVAFACDAMLS
jgi:hypothetical protein